MRLDGQPCPDTHAAVNMPTDPKVWPTCADCGHRLSADDLQAYGFEPITTRGGVLWRYGSGSAGWSRS